MMMLLLLGLVLGALTVIPPGPVSVTLVHVGMRSGGRGGVCAGAGIASADVIAGTVAVAIIAIGAATLGDAMSWAGQIAAVSMAAMGVALVARPQACEALTNHIRRPGRALFTITVLNPMTLLSWTALIAAVPSAHSVGERSVLAAGVMLASWCWHPTLGALAGRLGDALTPGKTRSITRASGLLLLTMGVAFASL